MRKTKVTAIVSVFLVLLMVFNSSAVAANSSPDAVVESITVFKQSGVLKGETIQLSAQVEASSSWFDAVEWSSNNPDVISCTKDGKIKGLVAGKSAEITCKAKHGSAKDSITVYCVERLPKEVKVSINGFLVFVFRNPGLKIKDFWINGTAIMKIFMTAFGMLARVTKNYVGNKVTACGRIDNYVYVRYGDANIYDGFVRYSSIKEDIEGFLCVTPTDMNVWANGVTNTDKKLTIDYAGDVKWTYDKNYVSFDEKTGQVIGLKPGTTTITANADGMTAKCTVHLLYKWPQEWVAKTNKKTALYKAIGNEFESRKDLPKGTEVTVYGDTGTSDGWAFACYTKGEDVWWGHIPIADVSIKGTISQYNLMNFRWPVNDINIKKISSPFGPRSSKNGGNHKGFDIVSDVSGEIEGESVVASYNGTITKIYVDNNKETSHGNAIVITTDKIDPISGKNLTVIYMHLYRWDTNSSGNIVVNGKVLKEGDPVTKEQIIGSAGNTGKNTSGAHLHYEVNNQNAAIRSGSNNPFTETINPIYFYMSMDESITKSDRCEAASNGNGFYWYGENE